MTSVSIRTSPKMSRKRIWGAEPGLREIPSHALLIALAWQKAPAAAAKVMIPPPMMIAHLYRLALVSSRGVSCANRGVLAITRKKNKTPRGLMNFLILFSFLY